MNIRKFFFWLHLAAGTTGGVIILIMSVTGVLLMYEKQMLRWADRGFRAAPPSPGARRLPVEAILEKVRDSRHALPAAIALQSDADAPVALTFGGDAVYANPYTGEILGEGSKGIREFFRVATDWHRYLGQDGEGRATARAITGACNLAFLFLVMSGFYLWWPRKWAWQFVRPVTWFRGGLSGKARDFNWHNVIGFWSAVPLFFVVLTASLISYPWATNLLYTLTGSEPPAQGPAAGRGPGGPGGESRKGEAPRKEGKKGPAAPGAAGPPPPVDLDLAGIDQLWTRAEQQVQGWQSISLRLPNSSRAPLTFAIDKGYGGQPQKRSTLILDRKGDVVRWEDFASLNLGRRLRSWGRFTHTGEAFGIAGQTVAGIASAGGAVLVWTGLALAWRRFRAWRVRRLVTSRPESAELGSARSRAL